MTDATRDPMEEIEQVAEARKALRCLFLAAEEHVARDVQAKVEAALAAVRGRVEALEGALRGLLDAADGALYCVECWDNPERNLCRRHYEPLKAQAATARRALPAPATPAKETHSE